MHTLVKVIIVLYALSILGILIANLVVGLNIQESSRRAADSSEIAAAEAVKLNNGLETIGKDLKLLFEWLVQHFFPPP